MSISPFTQAPHNNACVIPCMLLKYLWPENPKQFIKFLTVHQSPSKLYSSLLLDPAPEFWDVCVDAWLVSAGTAVTPAHHSRQIHTVIHLIGQRTARVTLSKGKEQQMQELSFKWMKREEIK